MTDLGFFVKDNCRPVHIPTVDLWAGQTSKVQFYSQDSFDEYKNECSAKLMAVLNLNKLNWVVIYDDSTISVSPPQLEQQAQMRIEYDGAVFVVTLSVSLNVQVGWYGIPPSDHNQLQTIDIPLNLKIIEYIMMWFCRGSH